MSRLTLAGLSGVLVLAAALLSQPRHGAMPSPAVNIRAVGALQPQISPDGERVAFSYQGAIWTMPSTGGTMTCLTSGEGFDIEPTWSADGKRLAYINSRNFFTGPLRIINADDGTAVELPATVQASGKLHFHPDGKRVLGSFSSPDLKSGEALAWFDLATGKLTPVTDPPRPARRSALLADGELIAFATNQDVPGRQGGNDGPQAVLWKVTGFDGKPQKIADFPARIHDVCWMPDRRSLIVTTDLGGAHYDLWQVPRIDPEGSSRRLTSGQADEDRPSVSHDGKWLLYTDNREGCTALVRRDLRTGAEQTLTVTRLDYRRPSGWLRLGIKDKATGNGAAARVCITDKSGKFYAPPGAMYRIERGNGHFYCRYTEFQLPAGEYQLRVWRGPEYNVVHETVHVEKDEVAQVGVSLKRWVDAESFKLYSGENHIHANYGYGEWYNTPESMLLQCEGEDLNVCNFMVANSDGDGVFDRSFFRGRPDPLSKPRTVLYWNEEYRSTIWGHLTLVNLRQVVEPIFTGFKDTTNPFDTPTNADTADRTRQQGGLVSYTHSAQNAADLYLGAYTGKGLPIDAALGKIDSMDLNNSYGGCIPLWYRLLNCGFRLPASAGTDCFLNRVASRLPGSDRVYVRFDGEFSYAKWIEALRAGNSYVTNGPITEIIVGGRHRQGETLRMTGPGKTKVAAKAWWNLPLRKVEIVQDGKVVATRDFKPDEAPTEVWEQEINVERSGWVAVRTSGPAHADNPGGEAFAHTSPVYIDVPGKPADAKADAEFFLRWIERLDVALRERNRFPTAAQRAHAAAQLEAARAVYTKLAAR
jgi:TolB protein